MCKHLTGSVPLSRALSLLGPVELPSDVKYSKRLWLHWAAARWDYKCNAWIWSRAMLKKSKHAQQNPSTKKHTLNHPASVFPAFIVSLFPSCPLSPPHDVKGDSREAPKVIRPLAITNTCFDRLACASTRKPLYAHGDAAASACSSNTNTHTSALFRWRRDVHSGEIILLKLGKLTVSCTMRI